jgi:hypothetical protein
VPERIAAGFEQRSTAISDGPRSPSAAINCTHPGDTDDSNSVVATLERAYWRRRALLRVTNHRSSWSLGAVVWEELT